jgi:hypothetical protein
LSLAVTCSLAGTQAATAACKAPRFRKTHPCGQLEDRRGLGIASPPTILIRASLLWFYSAAEKE